MSQSFETLLSHPVMESLGWVLLHFLWQGAAVAVVLFLVMTLLRRVSANARYLISCFALLLSARIREERENCCDDLATSISGDAASYVAALVRMEELRCEQRSVAVAARGGH